MEVIEHSIDDFEHVVLETADPEARSNGKRIIVHHSSHLDTAFNQQELMLRLWEQLGPHLHRFDLIVGTGLSGLLAVPLAAYAFKKRFAVVRTAEGSHSGFRVEGRIADGDRWLFLDDLISSGATIERVKRAMHETCVVDLTLVGVCLYHGDFGDEATTIWAADRPDHWALR